VPHGHLCPRCHHDLAGIFDETADPETEVTCPECGGGFTLAELARATPGPRGWAYFLMWLVSVLMVLGCCGGALALVLSALARAL